ncbi:hypothetical protein EB796_017360 [Bugula neritina]|uniref:Uncharacterized protein n=1 Tax=Bugula neritina TaxID=10212 RepID=A0A7J7JDJ7_BUGNE|nr:hypothetical protein EB796_017360 [Bugula neritina]
MHLIYFGSGFIQFYLNLHHAISCLCSIADFLIVQTFILVFSPLFILDTCRLLSVYDVHYNYTCIVVNRSYALYL